MNTVPIIIFDGPDNVGKGTQIDLLRKHFSKTPFVITNLDKPVGQNLEEKEQYGIDAVRNQLITMLAGWERGVPQIADRSYLTEYAYSVLRKQHELKTILELESILSPAAENILNVVFIDEVANITAREDGKSNYDVDNRQEIESIIERFHEIVSASSFQSVMINIHQKNIETVASELHAMVLEKFPRLI